MKSNADSHDLLKEVVAGVKDGHCEVYAGHRMAPRPRSWPFVVNFVKAGVVVTGLHPAVAGKGIDVGDLVRVPNGRRIEDWAERWAWHPRRTVFTFDTGQAHGGRLAVLINETCFSATDCSPAVRGWHGRPSGVS